MNLPFYKYQGAGNDFVLIDHRKKPYIDKKDQQTIRRLCERRFGIGGDGLILLENHPDFDFKMIYFNADGAEGSMCGNGGRCIVAFASHLGIIQESSTFSAIDGIHKARVNSEGNWVELKMIDVNTIECQSDHYVMNTGSPHYVKFVADLTKIDVFKEGKNIRYNAIYTQKGINVNFVQPTSEGLNIATYERGVEAETLACGTGVTAAAISYYLEYPNQAAALLKKGGILLKAKGGNLKVRFEVKGSSFSNIWLCGPAEKVFSGNILL